MKSVWLTVIGSWHQRWENSLPLVKRLYIDATRKPDATLLMCETPEDVGSVTQAVRELVELDLLDGWPKGMEVLHCPTPRDENGVTVTPYAYAINTALDRAAPGAIIYLDNGSDPKPEKFEVMTAGLTEHDAVYCTQKRTGMNDCVMLAEEPVGDPFCVLNYTQVAHRLTEDRWPLDLKLADPDVADGHFLRAVADRVGPFHPVGGSRVLDEHHIPDAAAIGVRSHT